MKKNILLALSILFSLSTYSQSYTFKKANFMGTDMKMPGEVIVSDTAIIINTKESKWSQASSSTYPIIVDFKKDNFSQYKVKFSEDSRYQITFRISENTFSKGDDTFIMVSETLDKNLHKSDNVIYYLIPAEN